MLTKYFYRRTQLSTSFISEKFSDLWFFRFLLLTVLDALNLEMNSNFPDVFSTRKLAGRIL